jgi:hypothetical protein
VWIHFGVLIAAVIGSSVLRGEKSLMTELYVWVPLLAGVAVSIRSPSRGNIRSSLTFVSIAALLMVGLDVGGSYQYGQPTADAVLRDGQIQESGTSPGAARASWVRTAAQWLRGDLAVTDRQAARYRSGDTRVQAVEALTELGLLLLCFATTGVVVAVTGWLGRHARFDSTADEAGARIAVAWLVSAAVMFLSGSALADQRFRILFGDAALWTLLTPCFGFLALGALGFVWAGRSVPDESDRSP